MHLLAQDSLSFSGFFSKIREALIKMSENFAEFIPQLLLAVVLLFLGFMVAKMLSKVVCTLFARLGIDSLLEKSGVTGVLNRAGIKSAPGAFVGKLLFWIAMLFVVKMAAQEASIKDISDIVLSIIAFMPNAITAALIMLVGFVVADMIKTAVFGSLSAAGLSYAGTLAKVIFGFIFILVLTVALAQLNIQTELLNATVMIVLGALGLALALCMGLGLKDMARSIVSGVYSRDIYQVGTQIEYEGELMKVAGVGPVTTKLTRPDGGFVIVPNEKLITEPVRGRAAE
ncbi:mechanosensitive ion channel [Verrucomicrobiaceae bacterium R5-34]|uniref:Mechanosensitive ion channel n=1 Tax=Oceaniferula flava TaxID=2800421 RepID=A0AAE2SBE5_9BACT|nr:mechanosensitive ion channel domain-containing protein [Oceaniferula flavus]MBK1830177.1 mechanosensitive ion channel [Verrucomicrobiaceae bacterium R5-34]MBK1854768.1 mechanosensitive ion channel [Oceaniferula flavus]MBM1136074.1 mechanosensitive ion channel [Oceaniferula flavus]